MSNLEIFLELCSVTDEQAYLLHYVFYSETLYGVNSSRQFSTMLYFLFMKRDEGRGGYGRK